MRLKLLFVALLGLSVALPAMARPRSLVFGLKGGVDYANLAYGEDADESDYLLGFGGGMTLGTPMSPSLGLDLDILYLPKGAKKVYRSGTDLEDRPITFETQLDYVVISPLLRISPGPGGSGLYMLAGPEFGYLLDASSVSSREGSEDLEHDLSDSFKELDIGLSFGMGFQLASANGPNLFVEGRYALGLTDISDAAGDSEAGTAAEVKTRGIYVFGGIRF